MTDSSFRKLRDFWYAKLKKDGFEDIEDVNSPHEMLIKWDYMRFQVKYTPQKFIEKQRYYQMAYQFLNQYDFANEQEKSIWELHAEGFGCREIAKRISSKKDTVHKIVSKLINKMWGY